jgi:hypothetical protein
MLSLGPLRLCVLNRNRLVNAMPHWMDLKRKGAKALRKTRICLYGHGLEIVYAPSSPLKKRVLQQIKISVQYWSIFELINIYA